MLRTKVTVKTQLCENESLPWKNSNHKSDCEYLTFYCLLPAPRDLAQSILIDIGSAKAAFVT